MERTEFYNNLYLAHHGIKGQKWGIRRYQNADGSLTPEGRKRYNVGEMTRKQMEDRYLKLENQANRANSRSVNKLSSAENYARGSSTRNKLEKKAKESSIKYRNLTTQMNDIQKQYSKMGYGEFVDTHAAQVRKGKKIAAAVLGGAAVAGTVAVGVNPTWRNMAISSVMQLLGLAEPAKPTEATPLVGDPMSKGAAASLNGKMMTPQEINNARNNAQLLSVHERNIGQQLDNGNYMMPKGKANELNPPAPLNPVQQRNQALEGYFYDINPFTHKPEAIPPNATSVTYYGPDGDEVTRLFPKK